MPCCHSHFNFFFRLKEIAGDENFQKIANGNLDLTGNEGNGLIMKLFSCCQTEKVHTNTENFLSEAEIEEAAERGFLFCDDDDEENDLRQLPSTLVQPALRVKSTRQVEQEVPSTQLVEVIENVPFEAGDSFLNETTGELIQLRQELPQLKSPSGKLETFLIE